MLVDMSGQLSDPATATNPETAGVLGDSTGSEQSDRAGFADLLADAEERVEGQSAWTVGTGIKGELVPVAPEGEDVSLPDVGELLAQTEHVLPLAPEAALPSMEMSAPAAFDEPFLPLALSGVGGDGVVMPEMVAMRELPLVGAAPVATAGQMGGEMLAGVPVVSASMTGEPLSPRVTRPMTPRVEPNAQAQNVPASAGMPLPTDAGPSFTADASVVPTELSAPGTSAGAEALGDQLASAQVTGRGLRNARVVVATEQGVVRAQVGIDQANESVTVKLSGGGLAGPARGRVSDLRRSLASHGLALEEFSLGVDDLARVQQVTEPESAHQVASQRFDAWLSSEFAEFSAGRSENEGADAGADAEAEGHESTGAEVEGEDAQGDAQSGDSDTSDPAHTASEFSNEGSARIERPYERVPRVGHLLDTRF